ncbi:hypothetical protein K438DRAFT_488251 [Mycena galopus ATCC 62051]|nr:hypothetical protein K438DRAFT_488251 [Mycena galopus ATCC 62051]
MYSISFPRPRRTGTRGRGRESRDTARTLDASPLYNARPGRLGAAWGLCGWMCLARHGYPGRGDRPQRAAGVWRGGENRPPRARSDSLGGISPRGIGAHRHSCVCFGCRSRRGVAYGAEGGRGWSREGEGEEGEDKRGGFAGRGVARRYVRASAGRGGNEAAWTWTCGEDPSRRGSSSWKSTTPRSFSFLPSFLLPLAGATLRCCLAVQDVSMQARGISIAASSRGPRPRPTASPVSRRATPSSPKPHQRASVLALPLLKSTCEGTARRVLVIPMATSLLR